LLPLLARSWDRIKISMATKFKQGYYTPMYPKKYVGNINKIKYMSSWELRFFQFVDGNPYILQWSSEEISIPYIKPTTKKIHKYYPDIFLSYQTKSGEVKWELIEIKPKIQTKVPKRKSKNLYEELTFAINTEKWKAAIAWCKHQSKLSGKEITFKLVTEDELYK
jgi:hypothetical protein